MIGFFLLIGPESANFSREQQQTASSAAELAEARELNLAAVHLFQEGNYKQAVKPATRSLEIRERFLPADDQTVIDAVGTLAVIHLALKNLKQAETLYGRVLVANEKSCGTESEQVAKTLDVLAEIHRAGDDTKQAAADYLRAISIREKNAAARDKLGDSIFKLGDLYQSEGKFEQAEPLYRRLLDASEIAFIKSDKLITDARLAYSCLLRKMKRPEEADQIVSVLNSGDVRPEGAPEKGTLRGRAIRLLKPDRPPSTPSNLHGPVVVQITIDEAGKVIRACAHSGPEMFWKVSEQAALFSEFAPTLLNGKPVKVSGFITYNF